MEIKLCNNKEEWNKGQNQLNQAEFLQSWDWGEFQEKTGKRVIRLLGEGWQAQGFEHKLSFLGNYIYIPRVSFDKSKNNQGLVISDLINYFQKKYIFIRTEPVAGLITDHRSPIIPIKNRQPQTTLILDLQQTEEQILAGMHSKTRYNIHLAEKHGVEISTEKNAEVFWNLNLETTSRDKFKSHRFEYYKKMLASDIVYQLTAYYKGKPISANICVGAGETFTYLHGASASDWRNLMAPYLLQWEGIKLAKKLNFKYYDFWGIASLVNESNPQIHSCFNGFCWELNHLWTGVTRFKVGFGGEVKHYPEACDIILRHLYYRLYKLARKIII